MSACNLQGQNCHSYQKVAVIRQSSHVARVSATYSRQPTPVYAVTNATNVATVQLETASILLRPTLLNPGVDTCETAIVDSAWASPRKEHEPWNACVSQANILQAMSQEISGLVAELDTELTTFLASLGTSAQQAQLQAPRLEPQTALPQPASSYEPMAGSDPLRQPAASSSIDDPATADVIHPFALAASTSPPGRPTGLPPLLSLPAAGSPDTAAGRVVSVGAGSRAERRRQNWRRTGVGTVAHSGMHDDAKFKASGTNSLNILLRSFTKDRILSVEEEQLLAAAARDFMQLSDLSRLLGSVLRRPPSLSEIAKSLHCDETALRVRMDCGSRARTLLAQKNYRLVVSIAKRLVRPAGAMGGNAGAGGAGGASTSSVTGACLDDAITVGMEALLIAIRKFKPEVGFRLSTYATWWIRLHVSNLVHAQAGVISVSPHQRANAERLRVAKAQLYAVLPSGVHPTRQELSEASGLTLGLVAQAELVERMLAMGSRSFEAPLLDNDGEASGSLQELAAQDLDMEDSQGSSALFQDSEEFAASISMSSAVEGLLDSLDRGEAEVLRRQFGLDEKTAVDSGGVDGGNDGGAVQAGGQQRKQQQQGVSMDGLGTGTVMPDAGVASGVSRLKLGAARRLCAARAIQKLKRSAKDDSDLEEWLNIDSSRDNLAVRSSGGFAKKSKG